MTSSKFLQRKARILSDLEVPDSTYTDASPKGSVDEGVRELISEINCHPGIVTTSSCAGRASVFLEGHKVLPTQDAPDGTAPGGPEGPQPSQVAGEVGGKGGGGHWLYVSHDPFDAGAGEHRSWASLLFGDPHMAGPTGPVAPGNADGSGPKRLIHFKFEPMILHVLTASPEDAQSVLRCGLEAGFRESGAINLTTAQGQVTPMVAIRSMGLGFESIIGMQVGGENKCIVSPEYLALLVRTADERFAQNRKRTERFRQALAALRGPAGEQAGRSVWEDAAARRERKKAEGLRKKAEMTQQRERQQAEPDGAPSDLELGGRHDRG
ncbi:hypothetical protein RB600_009676 [Gaeumannomyces tritici]